MEKEELHKLIEKTKKLTLLYVEDDPLIVKNTKPILNRLFDHILYAKDGQEGLDKYNENHIDIVITDINMPVMNGLEMLKKIEEIEPNISIIITTAHSEVEYYQEAIELSVGGYLLKPISVESMLSHLKQIVDKLAHDDVQNDKLNHLMNANKRLIDIGYQISHQKNYNILLETILLGTKELAGSDGGTLYLFNKQFQTLEFKIAINTSLDVHMGGSAQKITWPPLKLYNDDGTMNRKNVAVVSAMDDKLVNINDVYHSKTFDFTGAKSFDSMNNYRTKSMLVIPMKNRDNELIGVIQLINKLDKEENITSFDRDDEMLIEAVSAQAGMVIENNQLVHDLEKLLYSLIEAIGKALDQKSKYTANHIKHVAVLSEMIADAINKNETIFKDITFNESELEEIKLGAWLHDIGKITTPEHVVDKQTKLETIYDRIHSIKAKFEILKRDVEISYLKKEIDEEQKNNQISKIEDDIAFIELINNGDTFMQDEYVKRLEKISKEYQSVIIDKKETDIIGENAIYNLSTTRGTLTKEDRDTINNHVVMSYEMLKDIPMPKRLVNVARIAGSHHKSADGQSGYAHEELKGKQMNVSDKILAVADVFEALSARDRPYKDPYKLSKIFTILGFMVKDGSLDKDLVRMFFEDGLHMEYAKGYLDPSQIDEIDIDFSKFE